MIVGAPLTKQPSEIWPFDVDFASELDVAGGETIATAVFSATVMATNVDATATLKHGSEGVSGTVVAQTVKSGLHGVDYLLKLEITTSHGNDWSGERELWVRANPVTVVPAP